jgi:hypothetical protein
VGFCFVQLVHHTLVLQFHLFELLLPSLTLRFHGSFNLERFLSVEFPLHHSQCLIFFTDLFQFGVRVVHLFLNLTQSSLIDLERSLQFLVLLLNVFDLLRQRVPVAQLLLQPVNFIIEGLDFSLALLAYR